MFGIVALASSQALQSAVARSGRGPGRTPPAPKQQPPWLRSFKRDGYGFRYAAACTFVVGIYLHVTALLIGRDLFLRYIFTPRFDALFAVVMAYAVATGVIIWKRVLHPNRAHKLFFGFLLTYVGISVPIHVRAAIVQSTEYINAFPEWYGYFILPVMAALLVFVWRLEIKPE